MIHDRLRRRTKPSPQTAALSVDVFSELVDCNRAVNVWASSANSTAASSESTPTMVHDRLRRRTKPSPQIAALSVDVVLRTRRLQPGSVWASSANSTAASSESTRTMVHADDPSPARAALSVDVFSELVDCNLSGSELVWASSRRRNSSQCSPASGSEQRARRQ